MGLIFYTPPILVVSVYRPHLVPTAMEAAVILLPYDAPSISVGITRKAGPDGQLVDWPSVCINFPVLQAHDLLERWLMPFARPEHAAASIDVDGLSFEVGAYVFVPVNDDCLVVAGNLTDIDPDTIGRFLAAKTILGQYRLVIGYHDQDRYRTREADASWELVLSDMLTHQQLHHRLVTAVSGS